MQVLQQTAPTKYVVPESVELHQTSKITSCQLPQSSTSPTPTPSITIPTSSHSMVGPMSSAVSCNDTKTVSSGAQAVFHPPVSTCTFCRGAPGSLIKHASSTKGASSSTVPGGFHIKLENHGKSLCHSDIMIPEHENGTFNKIYVYIYIYIFEHTTTRHKGFLHVSAPWLACQNQCAMQFWLPIFLKKQCSPISSALWRLLRWKKLFFFIDEIFASRPVHPTTQYRVEKDT